MAGIELVVHALVILVALMVALMVAQSLVMTVTLILHLTDLNAAIQLQMSLV